ncbi:MAG: Xaa-Pro dipeptidase [Methanocella sp. PtaU1.Bin125]|nr:MAG: Xaa-Pro dipeptidase [Methanocella sp. PtaU1.Bin125]
MAKDKCDVPVVMSGISEHDANLYYVSKFLAPDAFAYVCANDKEYLLVSSMEHGRATKESRVKNVASMEDYGFTRHLKETNSPDMAVAETLAAYLKEIGVKKAHVPEGFPLGLADRLRAKGIRVEAAALPIEERRLIKTPEEIALIREAQRVNEKAQARAIGMIRKSKISKGILYYGEKPLTSERLQHEFDLVFAKHGYDTTDTIVAAGPGAADPHFTGSGPIPANQLIVIDSFPHGKKSRYWADMTRTVLKGRPTKEMKEMYRLVYEAQARALKAIRPGTPCKTIDDIVCDVFEKHGFGTTRTRSKTGYIHSVGHGVGLDIHEAPRLSQTSKFTLQPGMVVTVEPGLYLPDVGAVRIEDIVAVTEDGCDNLTNFPKELIV